MGTFDESENGPKKEEANNFDTDTKLFRNIGIGVAALTGLAVFIIIAYSIYSCTQNRVKKKNRDAVDHARRGPRVSGQRRSAIPRQNDKTHVSVFVKYSMFFWNFFIMLLGAFIIGIGIYAIHAGGEIDKLVTGETKLGEWTDLIHHVPLLVVSTGTIVFIISFAGCIGALRENMCLLRFYSISMLLIFLGELAMVGIGYYFSDKVKKTLDETFGPKMIENYRENDDFGNIIDLTQEYFECCGISNDGFRQWTKNEYFCCHNPSPESNKKPPAPKMSCPAEFPDTFKEMGSKWIVHRETCGVPHSCCITKRNETLRNLQCGDTMQDEDRSILDIDQFRPDFTKVNQVIYTDGCLQKIYGFAEMNLWTIGIIGGGILVSELMLMYLVKKLETQILTQMHS